MKNYVQTGDTITLAAPYIVAAGACLKVGSIVGVATAAAASGANVETALTGVYDLSKVSAQSWTQGALIYLDDSAHLATTVSSGNTLLGVATQAAANPSATGRVRLNAKFG